MDSCDSTGRSSICGAAVNNPAASNGVCDPRGICQGPMDASIQDFDSLLAGIGMWKAQLSVKLHQTAFSLC